MIIIAGLFLAPVIELYKVNVLAYGQNPSATIEKKNIAIAQGLAATAGPVACTSPQKQQSVLKINTIIQDTDHFIKVPVNRLMFGVFIQSNGIAGTFRLGLSNPLTICLNPGHFTATETSFPQGLTFGPTIYSLTATTINTSTNSACSADMIAGKSLNCTITNTVTGISPVIGTNNTATISNNFTTLSVIGIASANIKPDIVTLSLGVETTNKTANGAVLANSKLMNRVLYALRATGIRENETSTSSFNIFPNYSQLGTRTRGNITGFTVTNFITLHSFNIAGVSKWIDTSVKAGANSINSIHFSLSDKKLSETKNTLDKNAIGNAQQKANNTATTLGLRIVGIKSVNVDAFESAFTPSPPVIVAQGEQTSPVYGAITSPIIPGEQQVSEKVSIVFLVAK